MKKIVNLIAIAGFSLPLLATAQQTEDGGPGLTQEVITIGNRDIKLRDAYRISSLPQLFDTAIVKTNVRYEIKPVVAATKYEVEPIQAANLRIVEPLTKLYRVYLKGGVGMYTSPIGEFYFNSLRSRTGGFGVNAQHYSSAGGVKNVLSNGAFSQNKAQLWGKTFLGKHGLLGNVNFSQDVNHFYGYDKSLLDLTKENGPTVDSIRQRFQTLSGEVKFESYYDNLKKLNHATAVSFYSITDNYKSAEQNLKASINLSKALNSEVIGLNIGLDNNTFKYNDSVTTKQTNTIFSFSPQVITSKEKYKLKVGLGIFGQVDAGTKFYFFPDAEFSYYLVDNVIMPYAGLSGSVSRNSFQKATQLNPFVNSNLELRNSIEKLKIYAGIRGNFSASASFNLAVEQSKIEQLQFFANDTLGYRNRFAAVYDNGAVTHLTGELSFHHQQKFQLLVKGEYFVYKLDSLSRAFNLPNAKGTITGKYNMLEKLYLSTDLFIESNRFAWVPNSSGNFELVNIGKVIDLNLGVEYRYTKRLSAFLNFNNLASQKYQRYYRYNVQGINVFGGFSFSF